MLRVLISLLLPLYAIADWSQLYGGAHSNNYVEISPDAKNDIMLGWNYTVKEEYAIFYGPPAVSETGVVYLPYLEYPQYWLQLRAVRPNGSEMWMANWIGSDDSCSVVFLTNAVYNKEHNLVVLGWTCTTAGAYYQKHGQLMAYNADTGSEVWRSPMLYDANDMSTIAISSNVVYASGGYDCGRDGATLYETKRNPRLLAKSYLRSKSDIADKNNVSQIVAVDLKTGKLLHTLDFDHVGCYTQTKLFPMDSGSKLLLPANLPDGFDCKGSLLSLKCSSSGQCSKEWLKNLGLSWDAKFAFNEDGSVIFGSYGLKGEPDLIFGLKSDNGDTLFSNKGYCNSDDDYPSGPVVDHDGNAYYSCGNLVFAVDSKGHLKWKSKTFGSSGYTSLSLFKHSPAIHPSLNLLVFINTDSSKLIALDCSDGSVKGTFDIPKLQATDNGCTQPPIIAKSAVYVIKSHNLSKFYLFSISLHKVITGNK